MTETTMSPSELTARPPLASATIVEAFQRTVAHQPEKVALRTVGGSVSITWREAGSRVRRIAGGLAALGVQPGDAVAVLLPNTIEAHLVDYAALHTGAVPFGIFNSSSPEQIADQVHRSDSRLVVTQASFWPRVSEAVRSLGPHVRTVVVDGIDDERVPTLPDVEARQAADFDFEQSWRAVRPDDLATIIFTSGTTGPPKAVEWTHHNVMASQRAHDAAIPVTRDGVVSFLPLAHAGGRTTVHYMALSYGSTITVCPDMTDAPAAIEDARPDSILSVPRVFEKLRAKAETAIATLAPDARAAVDEVIAIGRRIDRALDHDVAERLDEAELAALRARHAAGLALLQPVLAVAGLDRLRSAVVGGAPSTVDLARFFRAIGVPFSEAYGCSETSSVVYNRVDRYKTGTAGLPLPGVEVALAGDGELLVRSAMNFRGYRGQPAETAATLDSDGWVHTGDIAVIDEEGFISIVDRKKELIITSSGKNMSPVNIENAARTGSPLLGQVVAIGDRRKYVVALITLDPEAVRAFASRAGLGTAEVAELAAHPAVLAEIERAVAAGNATLSNSERIKKYRVVPAVWVPDGDELTATGKIKRRVITRKYAELIDELYADYQSDQE